MGTKSKKVSFKIHDRPVIEYREPEGEEEQDIVLNFDNLSPRYKGRRHKFLAEYIKDFNGTAAIFRLGYTCSSATARGRACRWLAEPYTSHQLGVMMAKMDEGAIVDRKEVLVGLKREANAPDVPFSSNATTRIQALRSLGKILGMEITKVEGNMTVNGGVMAVPFVSPESWGKEAKRSQESLKKEVRK